MNTPSHNCDGFAFLAINNFSYDNFGFDTEGYLQT